MRLMSLIVLLALAAVSYGQGPQGGLSTERRRIQLPLLGLTIDEHKEIDRESGEIRGFAVDQAGRPVDVSTMLGRERAVRAQTPKAKWSPELRARFERVGAQQRVPVVLWLTYDQGAIDRVNFQEMAHLNSNSSADEVSDAEMRAAAILMSMNQDIVNPFRQFMEGAGFPVRSFSTTAPVIFSDLNAAEALALETMAAVDTLYLDEAVGGYSNTDANDTHRTSRVHELGVKGRGIRFANIGAIAESSPFWLTVTEVFQPTLSPGSHSTSVSACVASRHPDRMGAAPDVSLYCANPSGLDNASITAAGDWIITKNIDVTNMSWYVGGDRNFQYQDRYFEYQSRTYVDSYVTAAGNFGNTHANVVTPSKGWNVITVGSHTDGGDGDYSNDTMSSFSSHVNPIGGAEKPNIVANGQGIYTLDLPANGYITTGINGTSFASPHAAGNLCNAMVVNTDIKVFPEAAMALMQATAWHNIEGASPLSGQDGAGGINGLAAFRAANSGRVRRFPLSPGSFTNGGYFTSNISLRQGERARVCIAWSASASSAYSTSTLDADLDLAVFYGSNVISGTVLAASGSYNNNFEVVEFTAHTTGLYSIRVNDFRFDGASERLGLAWSTKYTDTSFGKLRGSPAENDTLAGPTQGNPSYDLDVDMRGSPGEPYVVIPSATRPYFGGPNTSVSPLTWYPITWDAVTQFWLQDIQSTGFDIWTGSVGTLDALGRSSTNKVFINDDPSLVGLKLYNIAATFEVGYPDDIKEFSEVNEYTILPQPTNRARSDNGSFTQALPAGFRFYGQSYTQCAVNMNGNITFGGSSSDNTPTVADMQNGPARLCFMWTDLAPHLAGQEGTPIVRRRQMLSGPSGDQRVVIEFINVPVSGKTSTTSNTVRVTLFGYTSEIKIEYLDMDFDDANCIVGITPGLGLTSVGEIDLSSSGELVGSTNRGLFEEFTGVCSGIFCLASDEHDLVSDSAHWGTIRFIPNNLFTQDSYRVSLDLR